MTELQKQCIITTIALLTTTYHDKKLQEVMSPIQKKSYLIAASTLCDCFDITVEELKEFMSTMTQQADDIKTLHKLFEQL